MPCVTSLNWIRTSTLASFRAKNGKSKNVSQGQPDRRSVVYEPRGNIFLFTFSSFKDERHALPTGIVDPQRRRSESRARGVWRDSIVIEVARFSVGTHVLAEERVLSRDRRDRT